MGRTCWDTLQGWRLVDVIFPLFLYFAEAGGCHFFLSSPEDIFSLLLEREEEGERETERETLISCLLVCPNQGSTCNLGMCSDWESNL